MINAMKDQTLKWCNRLGFNDPRRGFSFNFIEWYR